MNGPQIVIAFGRGLETFVSAGRRHGPTTATTDGVSTLGHVVESLGVPLTEVGALFVNGAPVGPSHIPAAGESVEVRPVGRPQPVPGAPLRFLLDVHLGTLARRLRLLGVDADYEALDIGDPALASRSAADRRVLLSRDRGLLRRRELWAGAYVYSDRPEEQLRDVLDRFRPALAPWTRCTACNGALREARAEEVRDRLEGGTSRTYDVFAQCVECGQVYWRGAHHSRLEAIVADAVRDFGQPTATTPLDAAVLNNAAWCSTVCATHEGPGTFGSGVWWSGGATPPYYPDAVTLSREVRAREVAQLLDGASSATAVKDSYACLDLSPYGFSELFSATWTHLPATTRPSPPPSPRPRVVAVREAGALERWQRAWSEEPVDVFRAALLDEPSVRVLEVREEDGSLCGGAVLNEAAGVTGLSNLFAVRQGEEPRVLGAVVDAAARLFPGSPLVGYESGEALAVALAAGFCPLGDLRVWLRT